MLPRAFRYVLPYVIAFILGMWAMAALVVSFPGSPDIEPVPSPDTATVSIEEDDPHWDCWTMGNYVCGKEALHDAALQQAWNTWDSQQGWTMLPVDPTREFVVDVMGASKVSLHQSPGTLVLTDRDGTKFQYRVIYRDGL